MYFFQLRENVLSQLFHPLNKIARQARVFNELEQLIKTALPNLLHQNRSALSIDSTDSVGIELLQLSDFRIGKEVLRGISEYVPIYLVMPCCEILEVL